jgi:predicted site-specific integrase-resolvase
MEPQHVASPGVKIAGMTYLLATHVAKHIGISRTTLWRWRHEGKIPLGRRYRNGLILFTPNEVEMVRHFADKLEPVTVKRANRLQREIVSPRRQ